MKDITQIDLMRRELETKKYTISEYQKSLELARLSLSLRKRELERAQAILEEAPNGMISKFLESGKADK